MDDVIRAILKEHGQLDVDADTIGDDEDLYRNGLTSHATVNVMLGLEDEYDFEFPDRLLRKQTFSSVSAIREALTEIGVGADV
jgi:acyl carrier protein